jgi:hypothetical protein
MLSPWQQPERRDVVKGESTKAETQSESNFD